MCILERCGHVQPGGAKIAILSEALGLRNVIRSNRTGYVRTRLTNPARIIFLPSFLPSLLSCCLGPFRKYARTIRLRAVN
jgi:hypothetical protein